VLFSKSAAEKIQGDITRKIFFIFVTMIICSMLYVQVPDAECKSCLFSFVQIGDVQSANETQLQSIVSFVLDNKNILDIRYVVSMGDIVEVYNNETDWEIKNAAFSQLTGVVPFGWLAGDNDGASSSYLGDNYYAFNVSNYPNMTSSYDQGRSTAQFFNFSGTEILFVNLEYFANETALQWFESLYQQYDKAIVIFSTHSYLDFSGNYTEDTLNSTYLDAYPRVNLVLCGHLVYAIHQEVNGRQEILFNYQRVFDYFPDLSDFVRVYTVFDDGTVDAWTYSQLRDNYLTDSANQFSFTLFTPPIPTSPTPSPPPKPTLSPTDSPSPTPTATPTQTAAPTPSQSPTPTSSLSPSPSSPAEEPFNTTYVAIGIIGAVAAIVGVVIFLRMRK
jgi:hypothetical protein